MHAKNKKLERLVYLSILCAIILILSYLPLKIGAIEMTLSVIPVVLGSIVIGPGAGAILGGFFGLCSFFQCFGFLGLPLSPFGAFVMGINPFFTILICFVPRILMGWLAGLIFRGLSHIREKGILAYAAANLSGALLNTIFFIGATILLFWKNDAFVSQMNSWSIPMDNVWLFVVTFVGINGLVEAAVCAFGGTAISKTVHFAIKRMN